MEKEFEKYWILAGETFILAGVPKSAARTIFYCGAMSGVASGRSLTDILLEDLNPKPATDGK